jgi:hypothetical protein
MSPVRDRGLRETLSLAALFVAAAFLRFASPNTEGLWVDEGYTYRVTHRETAGLVDQLRRDDAPPLYYLASKGVASLARAFGWTPSPEAEVRLLPAAASLAAVAVLAWGLGAHPSRWPALLLMSLSSFAVFYGRQGRSYAWVLLWVTASLLAARSLAGGRRSRAIPLALSLAVLLWSHNIGWTIWSAGCAVFGFLFLKARIRRRPSALWAWGLGAHAAAALAFIPWLATGGSQLSYHAATNLWMGQYWEKVPIAMAPLLSLLVLGPGAPVRPSPPVNLPQASTDLAWLAALAVTCAVLAAAVVGLLRSLARVGGRSGSASPEGDRPAVALEASYVAIPLLAAWAASLLWTPSYVLGRTDAVAFPGFVLLASRGLGALRIRRRRILVGVWCAASIAFILPLLGAGTSPRLKSGDRKLAGDLAPLLGPRTLVVHTALTGPSLETYWDASGIPRAVAYFPEAQADNPAAVIPMPHDSVDAYRDEALALRRRLESGQIDRMLPLVRLLPGATPQGATAEDLVYPHSVLAFVCGGLEPLPILEGARGQPIVYTQDWVGGVRLVLDYTRDRLVDLESLGDIEVSP